VEVKIQLGKTAKMHTARLMKTWSHAHDGGGVTVNLMQRMERETTSVAARKVIRKDVCIELGLDEAERLGRELLEGAREERRRQYQERRAAIPKMDHTCLHCGHKWHGMPDDRCPRIMRAPHPSGPSYVTDTEMMTLEDGLSPSGQEGAPLGRALTERFDRDVLNALLERGLIEFHDEQATWCPTSVGKFVVNQAHKQRRLDAQKGQTIG
jgi:hypothetical protein